MTVTFTKRLRLLASAFLLLASVTALQHGADQIREDAIIGWEWPQSEPYPGPSMPYLPGKPHITVPKLAHYRTEPDHRPMYWSIDYMTEHREALFSGYWFISASAKGYADGARIYDDDGELVYDAMDGRATGIFDLCDYKGYHDEHICALQIRNFSYILDNTYRQVSPDYQDVGPTNGLGSIWDGHDFHTTSGGHSFVQQVVRFEKTDLRPYLSTNPGWVETSSFFEADLHGKPFFHWNAFDHLDLWETTVFLNVEGQPNSTSLLGRNGTNKENAWDFCHLNAVSKDNEGFYYASARHLNTIVKIAGPDNHYGIKPGKIIWRLGGKKNNFKMVDGLVFSKQHDVRLRATTRYGQVITLFDNAWEGFQFSVPTEDFSSGKVIFVNNHTQEAHLIATFPHPRKKISGSRGGFDIVPNGNAIASWGHYNPELTEWTKNGTVLYHARYEYPDCMEASGGCTDNYDFPFTYRGSKKEWHAWPYWKPKVVAYAYSCFAAATEPRVYASWNGATEIVAWRFFTADSRHGPWSAAIRVKRQGFETSTVLPASDGGALPRYVKAQAIDASGRVLGDQTAEMFVPVNQIKTECNVKSCKRGFRYEDINNAIGQCSDIMAEVPAHTFAQPSPVASHEAMSMTKSTGKTAGPASAYAPESTRLTPHPADSHQASNPVLSATERPSLAQTQPTRIDLRIAIPILVSLGLIIVLAGIFYVRRLRGVKAFPWHKQECAYSELAATEEPGYSYETAKRVDVMSERSKDGDSTSDLETHGRAKG